jgi:hypothetical protein
MPEVFQDKTKKHECMHKSVVFEAPNLTLWFRFEASHLGLGFRVSGLGFRFEASYLFSTALLAFRVILTAEMQPNPKPQPLNRALSYDRFTHSPDDTEGGGGYMHAVGTHSPDETEGGGGYMHAVGTHSPDDT